MSKPTSTQLYAISLEMYLSGVCEYTSLFVCLLLFLLFDICCLYSVYNKCLFSALFNQVLMGM